VTKVVRRKAKETEINDQLASKLAVREPKVGHRAIRESNIRRIEE
jgi:hypothetical protein